MDKNPKAPVETVLKQLVNDRDNIVCHLAGQILSINSDSKVPTYEHRSLLKQFSQFSWFIHGPGHALLIFTAPAIPPGNAEHDRWKPRDLSVHALMLYTYER